MAFESTNAQVFDFALVVEGVIKILDGIGEDYNRPGLEDTPLRVARFWDEFIRYRPGNLETTFESIHTDQMVVVKDIRVYSLCEHHLLPFWADVSIGYLTGDKVLGLSKFARIAHQCAHKLQLQERLVSEIAQEVVRLTGSHDVAVMAKGIHTCMTMRGIKSDGTMISSMMLGKFRSDPAVRMEFLHMIGGS